jgi:hypothetical protein
MSLWAEFLNNTGRPIHKWKHYFPDHERHFGRYNIRPLTSIEIGCVAGRSLQMWRRCLGHLAQIVGIDSRPECAAFQENQIDIRIGDRADPTFLSSLIAEFGNPDVVLDARSHISSQTVVSFTYLCLRTAADGIYVVEDLQTVHWTEYGGGLRCSGSFIESCKELLDELNADRSRGQLPPTDSPEPALQCTSTSLAVLSEGGCCSRRPLPSFQQTRYREMCHDYPSSSCHRQAGMLVCRQEARVCMKVILQ